MNTKDTNNLPGDPSLLLTEYTALREEILKRTDIEHQLATFTILLFGTVLGIVFQNTHSAPLILLYPPLALFLSIGWSHSDSMTLLIAAYIKEHTETVVGTANIGWEHFLATNRYSRYYWAMRGIFISTQGLAIIIGIVTITWNAPSLIILLCVAIISFLLTSLLLFHPGPFTLKQRPWRTLFPTPSRHKKASQETLS